MRLTPELNSFINKFRDLDSKNDQDSIDTIYLFWFLNKGESHSKEILEDEFKRVTDGATSAEVYELLTKMYEEKIKPSEALQKINNLPENNLKDAVLLFYDAYNLPFLQQQRNNKAKTLRTPRRSELPSGSPRVTTETKQEMVL